MTRKRYNALTALSVGERNLLIGIDFVEDFTGGNPECYTLHVQALNHLTGKEAKGGLPHIKRDKEELIKQALQIVEERLRMILTT